MAVGAVETGRACLMFLSKEAVRLALRGHAYGVACDGCPTLESLVERYEKGGGREHVWLTGGRVAANSGLHVSSAILLRPATPAAAGCDTSGAPSELVSDRPGGRLFNDSIARDGCHRHRHAGSALPGREGRHTVPRLPSSLRPRAGICSKRRERGQSPGLAYWRLHPQPQRRNMAGNRGRWHVVHDSYDLARRAGSHRLRYGNPLIRMDVP